MASRPRFYRIPTLPVEHFLSPIPHFLIAHPTPSKRIPSRSNLSTHALRVEQATRLSPEATGLGTSSRSEPVHPINEPVPAPKTASNPPQGKRTPIARPGSARRWRAVFGRRPKTKLSNHSP